MKIMLFCLYVLLLCFIIGSKLKAKETLHQSTESINISPNGNGNYNLIKTVEKNSKIETSGLLISTSGRKLYESAYLDSTSYLLQIQYPSGEVLKYFPMSNALQGTGIGQCHYHLFQFTHNSRTVLKYRYPNYIKYLDSLLLPNEMKAGYGLTKYDHKTLVASDGTNRIFFLDCYNPLTVNKILNVFNGGEQLRDINALAVDKNEFIYATVYKKNMLYKINSTTGIVVKTYNLDGLAENEYHQRSSYNNNNNSNNSNSNYDKWDSWIPWDSSYDYNKYNGLYINGIAYDIPSQNFIVTGKNWKYLYIITLN